MHLPVSDSYIDNTERGNMVLNDNNFFFSRYIMLNHTADVKTVDLVPCRDARTLIGYT